MSKRAKDPSSERSVDSPSAQGVDRAARAAASTRDTPSHAESRPAPREDQHVHKKAECYYCGREGAEVAIRFWPSGKRAHGCLDVAACSRRKMYVDGVKLLPHPKNPPEYFLDERTEL